MKNKKTPPKNKKTQKRQQETARDSKSQKRTMPKFSAGPLYK